MHVWSFLDHVFTSEHAVMQLFCMTNPIAATPPSSAVGTTKAVCEASTQTEPEGAAEGADDGKIALAESSKPGSPAPNPPDRPARPI